MPAEQIIDQTTKTTPASTDWFLIQENSGSNEVKKIAFSSLGIGVGTGIKRFYKRYTGHADFPAPDTIGSTVAYIYGVMAGQIGDDSFLGVPSSNPEGGFIGSSMSAGSITYTWSAANSNLHAGSATSYTLQITTAGALTFGNGGGEHPDPFDLEIFYAPTFG